jgi:hypothetical protein
MEGRGVWKGRGAGADGYGHPSRPFCRPFAGACERGVVDIVDRMRFCGDDDIERRASTKRRLDSLPERSEKKLSRAASLCFHQ